MIRPITIMDAPAICDIYNYYVNNTIISFEEEPVDVVEMKGRIDHITAQYPWLVYEVKGQVVGFAYASRWKTRSAYRFTAEVTVYTRHNFIQKGLGSLMYEALLAELEERYIRSVMAVIALPNEASEALHKKMGFKKVAHFEEVGFKQDRWIDVAYWQRLL